MNAMSKPTVYVAGLLLAGLTSLSAIAAPQATGTAQEVLAIPDAEVAALKDGFAAAGGKNSHRVGEKIYQGLCQACHMPDGQGGKGAGFFPALAGNPKLAAGEYPASVVVQGLRGMPSFAGQLDDEQVANVVNYVRTSFGNQFTTPIKPEDVKAFRP